MGTKALVLPFMKLVYSPRRFWGRAYNRDFPLFASNSDSFILCIVHVCCVCCKEGKLGSVYSPVQDCSHEW